MVMEKEQLSYEEAIWRAGDAIRRYPLIDVQSVPLMSTIAENWKSISEFCPDPSDLLISTYPKAGKIQIQNNLPILKSNVFFYFFYVKLLYDQTTLYNEMLTLHSLLTVFEQLI